jgi:flagellar protein FliT
MLAPEVLKQYELLAGHSAAMLAAAEAGDRDALIAAERLCAATVAKLRKAPEPSLDRMQQRRKMDLILDILAKDRAVRAITEPWMAQLANLIRGCSMDRKVRNRYA